MNGAASLHRGNPAWCRSVSGLTLPRSAGRVSTLARERPVALSRGLPSTGKSSPRGFSTRLSPRWSNLAVPVPAPVTPFDRARGAPSPWVVDGPTPEVTSHRESAEPVCERSLWAILNVGVPDLHCPVVCTTERTRFTPALFAPRFRLSVGTLVTHGKGGILSLTQDRRVVSALFRACAAESTVGLCPHTDLLLRSLASLAPCRRAATSPLLSEIPSEPHQQTLEQKRGVTLSPRLRCG